MKTIDDKISAINYQDFKKSEKMKSLPIQINLKPTKAFFSLGQRSSQEKCPQISIKFANANQAISI